MSTDTPTDLQALQAHGTPVPLMDGTTAHMRYSLGAVAQLERRFGNLAAVMDVVQEAADIVEAQQVPQAQRTDAQRALIASQAGKPSMFGVVADIVLPALANAVGRHPRTGQPFYLGDDQAAAMDLLDAGQVGTYLEAFASAFREAFHLAGVEPTPPAVPPVTITTPAATTLPLVPPHPSPGPTGTTSPAPWPAAAMPSSGG